MAPQLMPTGTWIVMKTSSPEFSGTVKPNEMAWSGATKVDWPTEGSVLVLFCAKEGIANRAVLRNRQLSCYVTI
jgi:hypothetical protein